MNDDSGKNAKNMTDVEMSRELMRLARERHRMVLDDEDEMAMMRMNAMESMFGDEDPHMLSFDEIAEFSKRRRDKENP